MIAGIGTDVVEIGRVAKAHERFGRRFVERILAPDERERFERAPAKAAWLAKRFAAKEAFAKAIGTGIHAPFRWHCVSVGHDPRGKPLLLPDRHMTEFLARRGIDAFHISLSDDAGIAFAFVVLEGRQS